MRNVLSACVIAAALGCTAITGIAVEGKDGGCRGDYYYCTEPGTDPQVPVGTDPMVPYGTNPGDVYGGSQLAGAV